MSQKLKAIYENGILKPLEALSGISNQQVIDITIDNPTCKNEIVQLGGTLRNHPFDNLAQTMKEMRQDSWTHLTEEIDNE